MKKFIFLFFILMIGVSKGVQDRAMFRDTNHAPQNTWHKKYSQYESGDFIPFKANEHWWYFGLKKFYPKYKERYIYSSTILVAFTDVWHFWGFIGTLSIITALTLFILFDSAFLLSNIKTLTIGKIKIKPIFLKTIIIFISIWVLRSIGFHLIYTLNIFQLTN